MPGVLEWKRSLRGNGAPQSMEFTTGGAVSDGDLLVFSSGTVVKAGDAANADTIAGVALGNAASGAKVQVLPVSPDDIYETTYGSGSIPDVGSLLEVDVTSGVTTFVASTTGFKAVARLVGVVNATTKRILIRFVSPLITHTHT